MPEYEDHTRPKHHFAQHLAVDLQNLGPPRGYWCATSHINVTVSDSSLLLHRCFAFEGMKKVIKRITKDSNFRNVGKRILGVWSMRSAFLLSKYNGSDVSVPESVSYNTPYDLPMPSD